MTERRVDPFTGRGVLIAPARSGLGSPRPGGLPTPSGRCPFCPGHESDTEPTIARWPDADPWRVRVVQNKYPLVDPADGLGRHEVVIESPDHDATLDGLDEAHVAGWLGVLRDRVRALEARPEIAAVIVFRNRGVRAGSSQPHPHSQIMATAWVPEELALRAARLAASPIYADELARELDGPRRLGADDALLWCCPFAPSRPFEVRFMPRAPRGGFATATDAELASLARALRRCVGALRTGLAIADYNVLVRTPPVGAPRASWHVDLLPRRGGEAGFELASRERVVVVPPEDAAARLREAGAGD